MAEVSVKKILLAVILVGLIAGAGIGRYLPKAMAPPSGKYFDHLVIIAMENQNYADVLGTGTGSPNAPFLSSLLSMGSTIPNYHSYGATSSINGCSAACYVALTSGDTYGVSDGYGVGSLNGPNIIDSLKTSGLTYKLYCEDTCARGPDHFPFLGYSSTMNDPNIVYSTGPLNSEMIGSMNSASPASFYWLTPDDSNNMHDNSIATGDSYLRNLLVGSGSLSAPASGSMLASNIFGPGQRTALYIWWDEYDPSPNIQVGFGGASVMQGYVSQSNNYDEYASLHTIEDNWGLPALTANDAAAPVMTDIFAGSTSTGAGSGVGGTNSTSPPAAKSTTTILSCNPSVLNIGNATTCTANVEDPSPPFYGYGGILAVESVHYQASAPPSAIFAGESASNAEVVMSELAARGYNGIRVSLIDPAIGGDAATFDAAAWQKTLQIANHFNFAVIGDEHDYGCPDMSLWNAVFAATPESSYPNVIFEFVNEPHCSTLAIDDQTLINALRNAGDDRWVVLGCDNDCTPSGGGSDLNSFPIVSDPVNHVYYDFHEYYFYQYHSSNWSVSDAIAFADEKYAGVQDVIQTLGRPFLGTEFGADTGCGSNGPGTFCPPDQVIQGSCGYSPESLANLTELTSKLQAAGIGDRVWTGGDWSDGPVGITGCVDSPSFGPLLPNPGPSNSTIPSGTAPTGTVTFTGDSSGVFDSTSCSLTAANGTISSCSVTFTPSVAGTITITGEYSGDTDFGPSATTTTIIVSSGTTQGATPLTGGSSCVIVSSLTVQCTANVAGGQSPYAFTWNFGDGTVATGNPVVHSYASSGPTTTVLIVTDASGQTLTLDNSYLIPEQAASTLTVSPVVGQVYFPGDTATIYVQVAGNSSVGLTQMRLNLTLVKPDGTTVTLNTTQVQSELFKATYTIPASGSLGTYAVLARVQSSNNETVGAGITSFEVKPSWLATNTPLLATGTLASLGVGLVVLAWKRSSGKRKDEEP